MPNILITRECNRRCDYCFGSNEEERQGRLPLQDAERIIRFLKQSKHRIFSILGGEPSLHPDFERIIDLALENGLQVRVFTNGLMDREKSRFLFRKNIDVVLNLNAPVSENDDYPPELLTTMEWLGPNISPAFTIFHEEFDFTFIHDLIDRFFMRRMLRLGLAHPNADRANRFLSPKTYRKTGKKIARLAAEADSRNISLSFDCGFVLCMFTPTELGRLHFANARPQFVCSPIIDIDPDLNLWPCFPLAHRFSGRLDRFKTLSEAAGFFRQPFDALKDLGIFRKCASCIHLKRRQCTGGCLAHKLPLHPTVLTHMTVATAN